MPPRKRARGKASEAEGEERSGASCEEIRSALVALGESPGPITSDNRDIYARQLARAKAKLETADRESLLSPVKPAAMLSSPVRKRKRTDPVQEFEAKGLLAATYTPFAQSGELNTSVIGHYADWLVKSNVSGVFVNGTTGESVSLTVGERKLLAEEWLKASKGRLTVIVHVGCESIKDTCELAAHAKQAGVAAIGVMPPTYFKPATIGHLISYLEKVAESAGGLPMYYYHIPSMTGVEFRMEEFLSNAQHRLPTLRGMKFTGTDMLDYGRCVAHFGASYQIMYGFDQNLIGALSFGGTAHVGSTYNYAGGLYNRLITAFQQRDMERARLEQTRSQAMIKLLDKYGLPAGRELLRLVGVECGPPRLPHLPLSEGATKSLRSDLSDIGFLQWAN